MQRPDPVILSITKGSDALGARLAEALGGQHHASTSHDAVIPHIQGLFQAGVPIIGICASGILIRALAPCLSDKRAEPPVIAVSHDGAFCVPLLGGHRGANDLAEACAAALGGQAAVTTAGDRVLGLALDAPPAPWVLENPEDAKGMAAALIGGARGDVSGPGDWLSPLGAVVSGGDGPVVLSAGDAPPLVYRKQELALGIGAARGTDPDEIIALVRRTLAESGLSAKAIAGVYSVDLKVDEHGIHAAARSLGVPARFFPAATLEAETPRLANPSEVVFAEVGCHGVAEAAALAAAGPGGALIVPKVKTANATCAIAQIAPGGQAGAARGRLAVVGIGPGQSAWRTPEATQAIAEADELVGYGLYLDILGPLAANKPRREFALGEEELRCRYALERAGEGRNVALISSGDAGIFAMGALVAELLDRDEDKGGVSAAARRVSVTNVPGISALQAASARAGALLGHDFCAISLSDLLTPRETILQRLRAASAGDFVIAFYNPVSRRRRTLLAEAREILLQDRPADTPVLLASNLGRPDERLTRRTLSTLSVDEVDMLTVVLIGASQSRAFQTGDLGAGAGGWRMYTPRGYARKAGLEGDGT